MKVKFCHDNHANIHSKRTEVFDTEKDFNITDKEWLALSEDDKYEIVEEWAMPQFDYWFEEDEE